MARGRSMGREVSIQLMKNKSTEKTHQISNLVCCKIVKLLVCKKAPMPWQSCNHSAAGVCTGAIDNAAQHKLTQNVCKVQADMTADDSHIKVSQCGKCVIYGATKCRKCVCQQLAEFKVPVLWCECDLAAGRTRVHGTHTHFRV